VQAASSQDDPPAAAKPRRILVVEDNLDTVHTLARVLREMGHSVDYAINGYAAMELATRFKPDVILLDIGLPGMDGIELCRRLRADPGLQATRIFAVTGYAQAEMKDRALAAGCEQHFIKPLDPRALEKLLA
jgi:CheY-like chemotaxis protein